MTVLVVDDEPLIRDIVARYIIRHGFQVIIATGVKDAIAHLGRSRFDLVLTDFTMPDGTGESVVEEALARWPQTKVAVMSGDISVVPESTVKRVHHLLEKPDILAAIERLLASLLPTCAAL